MVGRGATPTVGAATLSGEDDLSQCDDSASGERQSTYDQSQRAVRSRTSEEARRS